MSINFCGLTVRSIQASAGWQEQISQLKVDLVPDTGQTFTGPAPGTPLSFVTDGFRFDGLVQNHGKERSSSINPGYSVSLHSPVEILEMVQLIMDGFHSVNLVVPNLFNVFGYLEGLDVASGGYGFGRSGKNPAGIRWSLVKQAILNIQNGGTGFGTGIEYMGHTYKLDLSAVPEVPDFYRVGGTISMPLMGLLAQVFEDAGYDFLVTLTIGTGTGPHIIGFKTRSRLVQPPAGQIQAYADSLDQVISVETGASLRNELTGRIIIGGAIEQCYPMVEPGDGSTMWQYWGEQQALGLLVPIELGQHGGNQPFVESTGFGNDHVANLNSTAISDIIGSTVYQCTVMEMRFAMHSADSWSVFIARKRPEVALMLGVTVTPTVYSKEEIFQEYAQSIFTQDVEQLRTLYFGGPQYDNKQKMEELYNFVKSQAETYLGKQYFVRMPFFLKYYFEEETGDLQWNMLPAPEGYWPDYIGGQSGPLGLQYQFFNYFMNDNGKFIPYVSYSAANAALGNFAAVDQAKFCFQDNGVFSRCVVRDQIFFSPVPCVLIDLDEPLFRAPPDPWGGITELAWLLDISEAEMFGILQKYGSDFPLGIGPLPLTPDGVNLSFVNNESTYGPWAKMTTPGKVEVVQNPELVPWNFGGFDLMNVAAEAQLADIGNVVNQIEESGSISKPGLPDKSLGDELVAGGPIITSVDISLGDQITTTYRMQSQITKFGAFSRQNADRLQRIGKASQHSRYEIRALFERLNAANNVRVRAGAAFQRNVEFLKEKVSQGVLQSWSFVDNDGNVGMRIGFRDFAGGVLGAHGEVDGDFQNTASVGLEGIFQPFTTSTSTHPNLPNRKTPQTGITPNSTELNKFTDDGNVLWAAHGNTFAGMTPKGPNPVDWNNARVLGLKGPLWLTSFGFNIGGKPEPNQTPDAQIKNMGTSFIDGYKKKTNLHKSGPISLLWCPYSGCWLSPGGCLFGTWVGSNLVQLDAVDDRISVSPFFNTGTIALNTKVAISYDMLKNVWRITSIDC